MLELKLAKSMMENEDGMNHLWIRLLSDEIVTVQAYELQIELPKGLYRSPNLNGFIENDLQHIVVDALNEAVILEIFTQNAIACGVKTITVHLYFSEATITQSISLLIVEEEEMDTVEIDEQVIERIKTLSSTVPPFDEEATIELIQPKIVKKKANEFSHLEKKYRVDY